MKIRITEAALDALAKQAFDVHTQCIINNARLSDMHERIADLLQQHQPAWEDLAPVAKSVWRSITMATAKSMIDGIEEQLSDDVRVVLDVEHEGEGELGKTPA